MTIVEVSERFKEALQEAEEFMLQQAEEFMLQQDVFSAARRADNLESDIINFIDLLERHPKIGHRADFYKVTTRASESWLQQVQQLLAVAGLDEYLEFNLSPYVVLYASSTHAILLSIRHEMQLGYGGTTD